MIIMVLPAEVCGNRGEYCLSEETSRKVFARAETAAARGIELEMVAFAA